MAHESVHRKAWNRILQLFVDEHLCLVGVFLKDSHIDKFVLFGSIKLHAVSIKKVPLHFIETWVH